MPRRPLTPHDVLAFRSVDDAQISPEGTLIAFVVGDSFKLDSKWPRSTIWVVDASGGEPRQLTNGPRTDSLPRWSPAGDSLAFLSDRLQEGQRQVFLISRTGGEAIPLTNIEGEIPTPRGLNALQWSPDGRFLAFLREDPETAEEKARHDAKDDAIAFEQNPKFVRIWTVNVVTHELRCVSPEALQIWEFAWSPDSRSLAAIVSDQPYEWAWYTNRLVTFPLERPATTVWHSRRQCALPVWSPEGDRIAFISSNWSDRGCVAGDVFVVDATGGTARNISANLDASPGWIEWLPEGRSLLAIAHDRGGIGLHHLVADGARRTRLWWKLGAVAEAHWPRFSRARTGELAIAYEDAQHPRDIWLFPDPTANNHPEQNPGFDGRQLTHLHPQSSELELGETHVVHWKGADGWEMQGLLVQPVGHRPGQKYPVVMYVHGGPTGVSACRCYATFGWNQLLANAGYAVFLPNYRGSVGWGLEFAESNLGDMGGKDFTDMLLGIDSLVESGFADPDRLAITGWSYGGFTAAWGVSQTNRFRAAVVGAGITHWQSFHGRSALADWDAIHYAESPYERSGRFVKFSPLSYVENFATPTLILHGELDQDVPVEQGYLLFRALKDRRVATELIVYPREAHAIRERAHLLDLSQRVVAWLQRYLG